MNNSQVCFIGHHGTSALKAKKIDNEGFKENDKIGWLGKGTYFFENNKELAFKWGKRRYSKERVEVLTRNIMTAVNKVFDISDPSKDDNKRFHKERNDLIESLEKKGYRVHADNIRQIEGSVIEEICREEDYYLVRAFTYTFEDIDKRYGLNSGISNGIELCVRKLKCIINN